MLCETYEKHTRTPARRSVGRDDGDMCDRNSPMLTLSASHLGMETRSRGRCHGAVAASSHGFPLLHRCCTGSSLREDVAPDGFPGWVLDGTEGHFMLPGDGREHMTPFRGNVQISSTQASRLFAGCR